MTARQFLSRLFGPTVRRRGNRFAPRLELLEAREVPAVDVTFTGIVPSFNEDSPFAFGTAALFSVEDPADPSGVGTYTVTLAAQNGTLTVTGGNVSVTGNGTANLTLVGIRNDLNLLFAGLDGTVTFLPTAFFSGDARVTVSATEGVTSDSESTGLRVQPVLSQNLGTAIFDFFGTLFATPAGFTDFEQVPVSPFGTLLDADGSETVGYFFTVSTMSQGPDPVFTLLSNGSVYPTAGSPNTWFVGSNSSAALRAVIDSFVLVPPPGFSGFVALSVSAIHEDVAFFDNESVGSDSSQALSGSLFIRFFQPPRVAVAPALAPEGGTIDLSGRFALSDPSITESDAYTFRLTAASGTLALDTTNPLLSDLLVSATASVVELTGSLSQIQAVLDEPGILSFTAGSRFFSGALPLRVVLVNRPTTLFFEGDLSDRPFAPVAFDALVPMGFSPVAAPLQPTVADVTGSAGTAVALSISLPPVVDPDGSEFATVFLTNVPADAILSAGANLGGGVWALLPAQLAGLQFLGSTSGTFSLTATAVVRDVAPSLGLIDEALGSAAFTVTLDDALAFGEDAPDSEPQLSDGQEGGGLEGGTSDFFDNEDFVPDPEDVLGTTAVPIGAFNLVEVPANPRAVAAAPAQDANPGAPREVALTPVYGDGEKHPLPPVLPLDQSVPVAGFSDSGGDSFALLDRLYRGELPTQPVALDGPLQPPAELPEAPRPHDAAVARADAPQLPEPVAAPVDVDAGSDWRVWAAAGAAVLGSAAAYALYARATRTAGEAATRALRPRARLKQLERTP